jgi:hypothetical protein
MSDPANPTDQPNQAASRVLGDLKMESWEERLLCWGGKRSGPCTKGQLQTLAGYVVDRYDWEKALQYVDGANNRLLNKARSLMRTVTHPLWHTRTFVPNGNLR